MDDTSVVRVYLGTPTAGKLLAEFPLAALAENEATDFSLQWDTRGLVGAQTITAVIDPEGKVTEYSEMNNVLSRTAQIRAAVDLRVDASDVALVPGNPPLMQVRVHNLGYGIVPGGGTVELTVMSGETILGTAAGSTPAIPARSGATILVPWYAEIPQGEFDVVARASPPLGHYDPDSTNDEASVHFVPPALEVQAPLPDTVWGGIKAVRCTASSVTRPNLNVWVSVAPEGGEFTGQDKVTSGALEIDTRSLADGSYVVRVTASDGVQEAERLVPIVIANAGSTIRSFTEGAPVTLPGAGGTTSIRIPAGARVDSGTLVVDAAGAATTAIPGSSKYSEAGDLVQAGDSLVYIYQASSQQLLAQVSNDGGATWSTPTSASAGQRSYQSAAAVNSRGIHVAFQADTVAFYVKSLDGISWTTPLVVGRGVSGRPAITAAEDGVAIAIRDQYDGEVVEMAVAAADGTGWSSLVRVSQESGDYASLALSDDRIHLLYGNWQTGLYYREVLLSAFPDASAFGDPVLLHAASDPGQATPLGITVSGGAVNLVYRYYRWGNYYYWAQRCEMSRNCALRDSWKPEAVPLGYMLFDKTESRRVNSLGVLWGLPSTANYVTRGLADGQLWAGPVATELGTSSPAPPLFGEGFVAEVTPGTPALFGRSPRLTPVDQVLDVGADGTPEAARTGMPDSALQVDVTQALNAYLSSHSDGDDGAVDGYITVPLTVTASGAGQSVLRNLEVRYQPLSAIAGYAEPPVFSPGASPGALDTSVLSMTTGSPIAVAKSTGEVVRTLVPGSSADRWTATFDGRDAEGGVLPSGVYAFGPAGAPVAALEIDDLPPTAVLEAGAEGSYGGLANITGVATDVDHAGSPKNFAWYVLEYTLDGATSTRIAVGTSPVSGTLARWDTRALPQGPATLRLTVFDRAGNSATTTRAVSVSPNAPLAPVIDTPTVATVPLDSLAPVITVAGSAEIGSTVTVYVNGAAVGSAPSDGRWSLAGVALPDGLTTVTASATRAGLTGPRSLPIIVTRYALDIAIQAPASAEPGSSFDATVTVRRTSVGSAPLRVRVSASDLAGRGSVLLPSPIDEVVHTDASGKASFTLTIDTRDVAPGRYQLHGAVVEGGLLPASGSAEVRLEAAARLQATLASDRAVYDALQVVALTSRLTNTGSTESGPLVASIAITDPAGGVVAFEPVVVPSIPAGQYVEMTTLYAATPHSAGSYTAALTVADVTGGMAASAHASFAVEPASGSDALAGTLIVNPTTYVPGDMLEARFTLTNRAGDALIPTEILVLSRASGGLVSRWQSNEVVASGGTVSGTVNVSTTDADGSALTVVLVGRGRVLAAQPV
jgi:hypothetical protein